MVESSGVLGIVVSPSVVESPLVVDVVVVFLVAAKFPVTPDADVYSVVVNPAVVVAAVVFSAVVESLVDFGMAVSAVVVKSSVVCGEDLSLEEGSSVITVTDTKKRFEQEVSAEYHILMEIKGHNHILSHTI